MDFRIGDDFQEGGSKKNSGDTFKIIVIVVIAIIVGLLVFLVTNALFGSKPDPVPEVTTTTLKVDDSKVVNAYKMVTYGANGKRNEIETEKSKIRSQTGREILGNQQARSQAVILDFMMEFENIQRQGEKQPFGLNFFSAPKKKLSEMQIFLDVSKGALGQNGTVDPEQLAFRRIDLFLHGFPLLNEAFGDVQHFVPFGQRFLASARFDALFFQRAIVAAVAFIHAGGCLEA